jgi:release factor glutamine methyltransferase
MNSRHDPASIRQLLEDATRRLNTASARLDAEVLLASVLGRTRSHLHAWPEKILTPASRACFAQLLQRRAAGEPVAYLTGQREFWSLPLHVTSATLIPRPETETLVTLALAQIPATGHTRIADLGTGSGAIALAIASERPCSEIIATDSSAAALETARANARRLGIGNVQFMHGNWCEALPDSTLDLIVCNPPYIPEGDSHLGLGDVRFEPRSALAAGADGMRALNAIAQCAGRYLRSGGWLMLEHGFDQRERVTQLLESSGFHNVEDHDDAAGLARVVTGRK